MSTAKNGQMLIGKVPLENRPSVRALVVPYLAGAGLWAKIMDAPPVPPELRFYPYKGINNKLKVMLNSSTGKLQVPPVIIEEGDREYFLSEYHTQTGDWTTTFEEMVEAGGTIFFRSDDPVDAYELFKLDRMPQSYAEFAGSMIPIDPPKGVPGDITDILEPNRKYYYCARSIDVHGNRSNPTHIYEIEIVDNNGQIYLKQGVLRYEPPKEDFLKPGRRFVYIEPAFRQLALQEGTDVGSPGITVPPISGILGETDIDKVWGKTFKVRITSKQTGRKMDLNLTFKNSGIVNASE